MRTHVHALRREDPEEGTLFWTGSENHGRWSPKAKLYLSKTAALSAQTSAVRRRKSELKRWGSDMRTADIKRLKEEIVQMKGAEVVTYALVEVTE